MTNAEIAQQLRTFADILDPPTTGTVTAPVIDPTDFTSWPLADLITASQNKMNQTGVPMPVATSFDDSVDFAQALIAYLQSPTA